MLIKIRTRSKTNSPVFNLDGFGGIRPRREIKTNAGEDFGMDTKFGQKTYSTIRKETHRWHNINSMFDCRVLLA